jgi:hypothetical protein
MNSQYGIFPLLGSVGGLIYILCIIAVINSGNKLAEEVVVLPGSCRVSSKLTVVRHTRTSVTKSVVDGDTVITRNTINLPISAWKYVSSEELKKRKSRK